jgi:hypothetical protein
MNVIIKLPFLDFSESGAICIDPTRKGKKGRKELLPSFLAKQLRRSTQLKREIGKVTSKEKKKKRTTLGN